MPNLDTLLMIARSELGTHEDPPNSNNVKYNTWYYGHPVSGDAYPWCVVFVQWVFNFADAPLPYRTASTSALETGYRNNYPSYIHLIPEPGDIVCYDFGHAGIVEQVNDTGTYFYAIEGNTNPGGDWDGGAVLRIGRSVNTATMTFIKPYDYDGTGGVRFRRNWKKRSLRSRIS